MADKLIDFAVGAMHDYNAVEEKLQNLETNMRVLTCRADDIITALEEAELHSGKKRKREVEQWLDDVERKKTEFTSLKEQASNERFYSRVKVAKRVDKMIDVIADLVKQSEDFRGCLLDVSETKGMPLVATEWKGQTFEQNLQEIWEWLMNEDISSIGIYGMGGVGKTTLATRIHNNLLNEPKFFGHVYWVTASQDASITKLQNAIAKVINLDLTDEVDEKRIAAKLFNALERRENFAIIVDDVWMHFDVDKIGIPVGAVGRKLVITSRSLEVCRRMGCQKQIKVKPLNEQEAWTFFQEKLGGPQELPSYVKDIAELMAKKCDGLPLGIITVSGSMKGVDDIHEWKDALNELEEFSIGQDDEVFQILQYSFNRLRDQRSKDCFLYCSLFPEDHVILRDELISYFISEGFLDKRSNRQAEFDQGHRILNRLENVCLLESVTIIVDQKETKCVKMHDLIRNMALMVTKTSKPRYMVKANIHLTRIPEEIEWSEDLDKVSLMHNLITDIPAATSPKCHKLSTLNLQHNLFSRIPDSFFTHFGALQVLDLSDNGNLEVLPYCISDMKNLTALLLRLCRRLRFVPPLGNLRLLRDLDLNMTGIEYLPEGVEKLVNLKCLDTGNSSVSMIPDGTLSKLSYLQILKIPGKAEIPGELEALHHLEEFQGRFSHVDDFNQFVRSHIRYKHSIFYDILLGQDQGVSHSFYLGQRVTCKKVALFGMEKSAIMLPEDIQELELHGCHGWDSCFSDDVFFWPNIQRRGLRLTRCVISNCVEMKYILKSSSLEDQIGAVEGHISPCVPLQNLEQLKIIYMRNLIGLFEWESIPGATLPCDTFASLKSLCFISCPSMTKLFTSRLLQHLRNLEVLEVWDCCKLEEIVANDGGGSESLYPSILPKLRTLFLGNLPNLRNICKDVIFRDSIETIMVRFCPNLKRLPLFLPTIDAQPSPPRALKLIEISELDRQWWDSLEWADAGMQNVLQPFVRFL